MAKNTKSTTTSKAPKVTPPADQDYQTHDPTGPLETPAFIAHASLSELNTSQVKIADDFGNLFYLEATGGGRFVLRSIPKVG